MLPASNRGAGQNLCFPDVCLTPAPPSPAPVPVPYPNIAMNCQATGFATNVKVSGVHALHMGSRIPMTMGDEAGVAHPTKKGGGAYTMGNPIVSINKLPAINLTCPTSGNNMNAPLGAVLVPSAVNVLYCCAGVVPDLVAAPGLAAALGADALRSLGAAVEEGRGDDTSCSASLLREGVGVITLRSIPTVAATLVFAARRSLATARALVLDLRGNRGGDLAAAAAVAGELLAPGTIVHQLDEGGDVVSITARSPDPDQRPLAVLIDGGTASSAELVAAALAHHGRARLVGERTYGKSSAQRVVPTPGASRYATVATFLLPDGSALPPEGLSPHLRCDAADALRLAVDELSRDQG